MWGCEIGVVGYVKQAVGLYLLYLCKLRLKMNMRVDSVLTLTKKKAYAYLMSTAIIIIVVLILFAFLGVRYWKASTYSNMPEEIYEVIKESEKKGELTSFTHKSKAEKIQSEFNWLIWGFLAIVLIQGLGVSAGIGKVLQDTFDIPRATSMFVVWLLALPLFLILRGMQILTNAILLDKNKDKTK